MLVINFQNIDEIIFLNKQVQKILPELKNNFQQWIMGKRFPALKYLSDKSRLEALSKLGEFNEILEKYFNDKIEIESLDYKRIKNIEVKTIEDLQGIVGNYCIYADDKNIYLTNWR